MDIPTQKQAIQWLYQQGLPSVYLSPLRGYSNYVFKVSIDNGRTAHSAIRLANPNLTGFLCPLNENPAHVINKHQQAAQLGLAPELLGFDTKAKIMWITYAGSAKTIKTKDFPDISQQLKQLHASQIQWQTDHKTTSNLPPHDVANLSALKQAIQADDELLPSLARHLLRQAQQRGYDNYTPSPIHSDLNPGNWLHDGKRWWLIDWDFAAMMAREWDYASLTVEHSWPLEQAKALAVDIEINDLCWFCCNFALLSYQWHQQRQTAMPVLKKKRQILNYWAAKTGFTAH